MRSQTASCATVLLTIFLAADAVPGSGQTNAIPPLPEPKLSSTPGSADRALLAMKAKADELKISGVALVASFDGDAIQAWTSKMVVVGSVKHPQTDIAKGDNLLAIAYAKAAEMADTLQNSGSKVRPPMTGEFGWEGGVIAKTKTGHVIAAFSGGKSEDDVAVSRAGLAILQGDTQTASVKH